MRQLRDFAPVIFAACATSLSCRESTAAGAHVRERWYQRQTGESETRPAVLGDLVFFGTGDGKVVARRQSNGGAAWTASVATDAISGSNMALQSNTLVVPILRETVALDASTGRQIWRYGAPADTAGGRSSAIPGQVRKTHLAADASTVYIPAWGASISAVTLATGAVRWVWQAGPTPSDTATRGVFRSGSQGVAIAGDTLYATAWHFLDANGLKAEAWLLALNRTTGAEFWRITMPSYTGGAFVWGAPVVNGRMVIFEAGGGHEYGIDRFTTQLVWEYKPNTLHGTEAATELFDGIVYHDGGDGYIYALRASDGSLVWRGTTDLSLGGAITNRDMLVTSRRVIFSDGMTLHVLDRQNGRLIASTQQPRTSDSYFASPAAYANGQIFVSVGDGAWSFDEP